VNDFIPSLRASFDHLWGPWTLAGFGPLLVFLTCVLNIAWLVFVSALVARTTAYAAVNITTFEALMRPQHIQRRWPKSSNRFWFLKGCTFLGAVKHCWGYWSLDMEQDEEDFQPREGRQGHSRQDDVEGQAQDPKETGSGAVPLLQAEGVSFDATLEGVPCSGISKPGSYLVAHGGGSGIGTGMDWLPGPGGA